jgi:hypothetical protein
MMFKNLKPIKSLTISAVKKSARDSDFFLSFEWVLNNGIIRTNNFFYEDCEIMNAIFDDSDDHCSFIKIRSKLMLQLLEHLSHSRSYEILLTPSSSSFSVHSYYSPELSLFQQRKSAAKGASSSSSSLSSSVGTLMGNNMSLMNTGISISINEFDTYDYHSEEEQEQFIFTIKEVTGFVAYCELNEFESFHFHFLSGGR